MWLKRIQDDKPEGVSIVWQQRAKDLLKAVELEEYAAGIEKETNMLKKALVSKPRPGQILKGDA